MFSQQQNEKLLTYTTLWNRRCPDVPLLQLDSTFPSLGVLDLQMLPFSGRKEILPSDQELLRMFSLYCAQIVNSCWNAIGVADLVVEESPEVGLRLRAANLSLNMEQAITELILRPPTSLAITRTLTRQVASPQGWIGPFILGCCTGLSPWVQGAWEEETPETFQAEIQKVKEVLGQGVVLHYERCFPGELLGQFGELYLYAGIFPPLGVGESFIGQKGSKLLLDALRAVKASKKGIAALSENLAASPDEHLSCLGLILGSALTEKEPTHRLRALAETKGNFVSLLRSAMISLRKELLSASDWIEGEKLTPVDLQQIEIERQLGFLPWLYMSTEYLPKMWADKRFRKICEALTFFDYDTAADLCQVMTAEDPKQFELRLQHAYLKLLNRQYDEVEYHLRVLLSEPECETEPRLFSLWGINDLHLGKQEDALRHLSVAYSAATVIHPARASITNDYGWMLLQSGQPEEALRLFHESRRLGGSHLTSLLNEAAALKMLGRAEERAAVLSETRRLSPLDRRVFVESYL